MTSIIQTFPVEIISSIIDYVADIDKHFEGFISNEEQSRRRVWLSNVRACSLTCGTFLPLCRKYIFSTLSLQFDPASAGQYSRATSFLDLVAKTPDIAHCIQTLKVNFCFSRLAGDDEELDRCISIASAIQKLTRVKTIWLRGDFLYASFDWKSLPNVFHNALFHVMSLPTVSTLYLFDISNFTLSSLAHCPSLKVLIVLNSKTAEDDEWTVPLPLKPLELTMISVDSRSISFLPEIFVYSWGDEESIFSLERLQDVSISMDEMVDIKIASDFLHNTTRVENVYFAVNKRLAGMALTAIVPCPATLKNFTLHIEVFPNDPLPLSGISRPMHVFAVNNHLESLHISIVIHLSFPFSAFCAAEEWNELENALLGPGWPNLKLFTLTAYSLEPPNDLEDAHERRRLITQKLHRLASTKSFEVVFHIEDKVWE